MLVEDSEDEVRSSFFRQAEACRSLGSPFTARLCLLARDRLDRRSAVGRAILGWKGDASAAGDAVPLRLAGALHSLVVTGRSPSLIAVYPPNHTAVSDDELWGAVEGALDEYEAEVLGWLESAPQTNEVRRCGVLLPGFLTIARLTGLPMTLSEVGASAGLNLRWDRYRYELGRAAWGDSSSPVVLSPEWRGPDLAVQPIEVLDRAGCDLNPLDPTVEKDRVRALSYIWADQIDRLERTRAALDVAAAVPAPVDRTDAVEWLERRLSATQPAGVHVVYHSIVWQYLPHALRARGEALLAAAGSTCSPGHPLAWLRLEHDGKSPGAALTLTMWPGGEQRLIARADFHGRWIDWIGWHDGPA